MLGHQEKTAFMLLAGVAVIVVASHGVLTLIGNQPFARPLSNTSADGELVIFEGRIDSISQTKSGGHLIVSVSNRTVFIPAQAAQGLTLQKGQNVSIYGTVETYRGKKEIVVNSAGDVRYL